MASPFDVGIVFLYFGVMIAIAAYFFKKQKNIDSYLVAGRKVGVFRYIASNIESFVGAGSSLAIATLGFKYGICGSWYLLAASTGVIVFALLMAPKTKMLGDELRQHSYPQLLGNRYDWKIEVIASINTMVAFIAFSSAQMVGVGLMLSALFQWDLTLAIIAAGIIIIVYTMLGGLMAVFWTDFAQFILHSVGLLAVICYGLAKVGGWGALKEALPASYFNFFSSELSSSGFTGLSAIIFFIIAIGLSIPTSMDFYQRTYALKDAKLARRGLYASAVGMVFLGIIAAITGMIAKALFSGIDPDMAAVTLISSMPKGLLGLGTIALLAALMSCADSCLILGSATFVTDIWKPFRKLKKNPETLTTEKQDLLLSKLMVPIFGLTALILGFKGKSILGMLLYAFSIQVGGLLVVTIAMFWWKKATPNAAAIACLIGTFICIIWWPLGFPFGWDGCYPGIILSTIALGVLSYFTKPTSKEKIERFFRQ